MQQPSGGGVSANQRDDVAAERPRAGGHQSDLESSGSTLLRDRLQTGATATRSALTEQMRRVSHLNHRLRDPLTRPSTWIVKPSWSERLQNWLAEAMPFSWRERARHHGFWRRRVVPTVAVFACLAVGLSVGVFALKAAGHAAGALTSDTGSATAQATVGGSVMISPLNNVSTTPTPVAPPYDVGVWVSDTLPQGGSVTVYVRVSNNSQPQPGAKVWIVATTPHGTIKIGPQSTDAYGLTAAQLNYGGVGPQQPITVTAATNIGGQTYTGSYTFVTFG